eukprot:5374508-Pyramimonas_sp.AAC.1
MAFLLLLCRKLVRRSGGLFALAPPRGLARPLCRCHGCQPWACRSKLRPGRCPLRNGQLDG